MAGRLDVEKALGELSARQFNEWRAYNDLEPFGEERDDIRTASIVSTLLNIFARKRHPAPWRLADCVVKFGEDDEVAAAKADPAAARERIRRTMDLLMLIFNSPKPKVEKAPRTTTTAPSIPLRRNAGRPVTADMSARHPAATRQGRR